MYPQSACVLRRFWFKLTCLFKMSSEDEEERAPCADMNDSRGSSISSTMKNDYDELMKFVNIVPENILGPDRSNAQQQKFRRCSTGYSGSLLICLSPDFTFDIC